MVEVRGSFGSPEEWQAWCAKFGPFDVTRQDIVNRVRDRGFVEPITGIRRHPHEILINESNLHETLSCMELNSRKRALLAQIQIELRNKGWAARRNLRILGAEAVSRVALVLRGRYPYYLGAEYLPDETSRERHFPLPHVDLQAIPYGDGSFEVFVSGDVFEHIPDLDRALQEVVRVLKPGGILVSTFPFTPQRIETEVRASLDEAGHIIHHLPAEYHGNPVDPPGGSLVFQFPGWDILQKLRNWGCSAAYFSMIASSQFGIASDGKPGPFVLVACKEGGRPHHVPPPGIVVTGSLPEKLCTMVALPRSGTTVLTSMFAVHSEVIAVFEPWNSKVLDVGNDADSDIGALAAKERLPPLDGKILFVKETAARPEYIRAIRKLHENAPFPVDKQAIVLLRNPDHTLLSEVERRNEWWGDNVALDKEFIANWGQSRGRSLWQIIEFARSCNATVIAFEELARHPAKLMRELADRIGFRLEREQLEYEKFFNGKQARGDLNVSRNPEAIDVSRALSRQDKVAALAAMISDSPAARWFEAFRALHADLVARGGIASISALPDSLIEDLRPSVPDAAIGGPAPSASTTPPP